MPKSLKDDAYSSEHVRERALERYNITLTPDDYTTLVEVINRSGNVSDTEVQLLNEEGAERIWGARWPLGSQGDAATTLVCVWSIALCRITTLLPQRTIVRKKKGAGGQKKA